MPSRGIVRVGGIQCRRVSRRQKMMALQLKASLLAAFAISAVSLAVRALWLIYVMRIHSHRIGPTADIPRDVQKRGKSAPFAPGHQKQEKSVFLAKSCLFQIGVIVELIVVLSQWRCKLRYFGYCIFLFCS
ncbi:hypothetical protein niasHT_012485 [Heterodera trifolii]|uniref:Uncharacterized protein n=1 Tax=Heterodera trifolii TaxID=157864 RepID=A0ABD2KUJ8_9BILA